MKQTSEMLYWGPLRAAAGTSSSGSSVPLLGKVLLPQGKKRPRKEAVQAHVIRQHKKYGVQEVWRADTST